MKYNLILVSLLFSSFAIPSVNAQMHSLKKIWETDTLLKTPESVLYYPKDKILFVSNIDGAPDAKDGKGSIAKLGLDGTILEAEWVKGLQAPKGMGIYKNKLYVADLTEVVVINISEGQIVEHIPIEGSVFLNDISIDRDGAVYVSDTRTGNVHRIAKGFVTTQLKNLKGPNGLLVAGDDLLVLDRGQLLNLHGGDISAIADGMDPSTDGIEMVKPHEYIVSCWNGIIYYLQANGNKQVLLDTREQKHHTADIGYDAKNRIVYVPAFYGNKVTAYVLE